MKEEAHKWEGVMFNISLVPKSLQVGGGHENGFFVAMKEGKKSTSGRGSSGDGVYTCGRVSRGDIWGLLVRESY